MRVVVSRARPAYTCCRAPLASEQELDDFLRSVERRAFKRTAYTVRDDEAALDIVQDAMMRLVERYADRPASELAPLFQRILGNATMDWFRRQRVRNGVVHNLQDLDGGTDDTDGDILERLEVLHDTGVEGSDTAVSRRQVMAAIEAEIAELPLRQREAFLLRYWEEFDVAETAQAMGCTEGSVKTHCSRAVHALARALRLRGIVP
jgi:RNA polymerase sigma-70 factor (ECF subfamily)